MRSENSTIFSGLNATLLWTNPNPTNTFNSQRISLKESFANFDYIGVEYKKDASSSVSIKHTFITIDKNELFDGALSGSMTMLFKDDARAHRVFKLVYSSELEMAIFNAFYSDGRASNLCVPIRVYGIKGKINGIE